MDLLNKFNGRKDGLISKKSKKHTFLIHCKVLIINLKNAICRKFAKILTQKNTKKVLLEYRMIHDFCTIKIYMIMNRKLIILLNALFLTFSLNSIHAQCVIDDVDAEAGACDGGVFWVTINFQFDNVGNEGFKVQGNGNNYGNFDYGDLPITVGPLDGDGITEYEFVVTDNQFSDCSDFYVIDPVSCGTCELYDLTLEPGDCNNSGNYDLWIDFGYSNPTHTHFDVIYDNGVIGYFALADLPVKIENFEDNGENTPFIQVCINDNPDCCVSSEFVAPNCGSCEIWDLHAPNVECDGDQFYITLDFNYANVGNDGFTVHGNGTDYGTFSYNDLPVVLGPLPANGTFYEFVVKDSNHPDCSDFIEYGEVDCNGGGCNIHDLVLEAGNCNDDGTYNIWINFEYENATNDLFDVIYENQVIGTFELNELPVWIEHFVDNGEPSQGMLICINDDPDCCEDVGFDAPDCDVVGDCEFWDFLAEAQPCSDDGLYMLDFEFNAANVGPEGFIVIANGTEYGPFNYDSVFYTIGPLHGGVVYEILIQDVAHPDCHYWNEFGPVFCDDNCHIYNLTAEISDCDDDGQFYVTIDFDFVNTGNDGYKIAGNGNVYGFFGYDHVPITLGPFESGAFDAMEFVVTDAQQSDCGDAVEILVPNCNGNDDCSISDVVADVTDCFDNGTFYVVLDFEYSNTSNIGFRVDGNGVNYGLFGYDELPISIGPLVGNGTTPYEFVVSDLNHHDCSDYVEIGPVDCDISGDCAITDLVVDPGSCLNDGTYNLWLNFNYQNSDNIYFDVIYNGQVIDYFPLASLPVVIPHFHSDGNLVQEITVCINDNDSCCTTVEFDDPQCMGPNITWPGDIDFNNIANNFDLLGLGVAYLAEGPPRLTDGIDWQEFDSPNWDLEFATGLDFKHADCNGDGIVDKQDIQAIVLNYNKTHGEEVPAVLFGGDENAPPFYADLPEAGAISQGSPFFAPIMLGSDGSPVDNIYGVAFTLEFDPEVVDPLSIELQFDGGWLGTPDEDLLTLDKSFAASGRIEVAMVRSDQNDVSGYGQVLGFIGIIDNIAGKEELKIGITDVKAIRSNESLIPLSRPVETVDFSTGTNEARTGVFKVFPNPSSSFIFLQHPDALQIETVTVQDLNGRTLITEPVTGNKLDISKLPAGVFVLQIETPDGVFFERLVKI